MNTNAESVPFTGGTSSSCSEATGCGAGNASESNEKICVFGTKGDLPIAGPGSQIIGSGSCPSPTFPI